MKKKTDLLKVLWACLTLAFCACESIDPIPEPEVHVPGSHGVFILNEGTKGQNNATLSYYNLETDSLSLDIMGGKLGDTAQDMIAYGNKLYIALCISSNITVLDMETHQLLKRIPVMDGNKPREPRYLAAYEGKIYATTYDGNVIRLDTASLSIESVAKAGTNPEGIAAVNGKLYVANGGGMNFNLGLPPDSTLSVIDIASFKEEKTIRVGVNPYIVKADKQGNIYLTYQGNYNSTPIVPGGMQKLNTQTGEITRMAINANQKFVITGDWLYFYNVTYDKKWNPSGSFGVYNITNNTLTDNKIIPAGTVIPSPYAININPKNQDIYISNSLYPGKSTVYVFGADGKKKTNFETGIGSNSFVFY